MLKRFSSKVSLPQIPEESIAISAPGIKSLFRSQSYTDALESKPAAQVLRKLTRFTCVHGFISRRRRRGQTDHHACRRGGLLFTLSRRAGTPACSVIVAVNKALEGCYPVRYHREAVQMVLYLLCHLPEVGEAVSRDVHRARAFQRVSLCSLPSP